MCTTFKVRTDGDQQIIVSPRLRIVVKGEGGDEGKQEYNEGKTLHCGSQILTAMDLELQINKRIFCLHLSSKQIDELENSLVGSPQNSSVCKRFVFQTDLLVLVLIFLI